MDEEDVIYEYEQRAKWLAVQPAEYDVEWDDFCASVKAELEEARREQD